MKLICQKNNHQSLLNKRLIYIEAIPVPIESIANKMGREMINKVPDVLKNLLSGQNLEALKRTLFVKSKDAMLEAAKRLGPQATEAEIRAAMSKAAEPVAKAMFDAELKVAQQAATAAAEKLAADAAAKAVADAAAKAAARTAAGELVTTTAATGTEAATTTALTTTGAETGATALTTTTGVGAESTAVVEAAAAGAGVTAAAVLAAVAGVGLAVYEGYKLHQLVSTIGFETRAEVEARTLRSQGDFGYDTAKIPDRMNEKTLLLKSKFRSASTLVRDTSTEIASNADDYKTDDEFAKTRLSKSITYGEELSKQMSELIGKSGPAEGSYEWKEAVSSLGILVKALNIARNVQNRTNLDKYSEAVKDYRSDREKAYLDRDKNMVSTKVIGILDRVNKLLESKKKSPEATSIAQDANDIQRKIADVKTSQECIDMAVKLNAIEKRLNVIDNKTLLDQNNFNDVVGVFVTDKLAANDPNRAEVFNRVRGLAAAQIKDGMTVDEFTQTLNKLFPGPINLETLPKNTYFSMTEVVGDGKKRQGFEGYLLDPLAQSYVVGMVERAKALEPKVDVDKYVAELKRILNDPQWRTNGNAAYGQNADSGAFNRHVAGTIPTPEKFFNIKEVKKGQYEALPGEAKEITDLMSGILSKEVDGSNIKEYSQALNKLKALKLKPAKGAELTAEQIAINQKIDAKISAAGKNVADFYTDELTQAGERIATDGQDVAQVKSLLRLSAKLLSYKLSNFDGAADDKKADLAKDADNRISAILSALTAVQDKLDPASKSQLSDLNFAVTNSNLIKPSSKQEWKEGAMLYNKMVIAENEARGALEALPDGWRVNSAKESDGWQNKEAKALNQQAFAALQEGLSHKKNTEPTDSTIAAQKFEKARDLFNALAQMAKQNGSKDADPAKPTV